ncbi:presequence protease, mitochondrial-like isoform X2 [Pteropus vampyrus]|uniref:Presequence protease, mitochondrial-like isoform X2 n=1 Tax=Pteropus vampyrus TaxID=132908 RepID=A0A6P6CZK5_PTEVA|nr:presequence protease, mitochondrial-like isoform X2 [Pteropus vampyrus]
MGREAHGKAPVGTGSAAEVAPVIAVPPGLDHFLYGLTDEMGQAQREQLFAVHRGALIDVAHRTPSLWLVDRLVPFSSQT